MEVKIPIGKAGLEAFAEGPLPESSKPKPVLERRTAARKFDVPAPGRAYAASVPTLSRRQLASRVIRQGGHPVLRAHRQKGSTCGRTGAWRKFRTMLCPVRRLNNTACCWRESGTRGQGGLQGALPCSLARLRRTRRRRDRGRSNSAGRRRAKRERGRCPARGRSDLTSFHQT